MPTTKPPESPDKESLDSSYRQSLRELRFILAAWVGFALWIVGVGALTAFHAPGEEVPLLLGMPRWVVLSVILPWLAAFGLIYWFALKFMKDTNLEGDGH